MAHTKNYGIFELDRHVIASQHGVHLIEVGFLMDNHANSRIGFPAFETRWQDAKSL